MGDSKSKVTLVGFLSTLLVGCSWDNSPPPYHTVIRYDPSRAQTYVSTAESTNTPSTRDWKTNDAGVYGYSGSYTPPSPQAVGGAVSSPSGVSSGAATGTTSPASGTPGAIIGSPSGTSITGSSPGTPTLPGPITPTQPAPPPSSTLFTTPSQYPASTTPSGLTNTSSGVLFTNRYTAPTNTFPIPGINPRLNGPTP